MHETRIDKQESEAKSAFTTTIPVRIDDVNYGGHLDASKITSLLHTVRVLFLKEHGLAEDEIEDCTITTRELNVKYKAPAHFNDQLEFTYKLGNIGKATVETLYEIKDQQKGSSIAIATIVLSFLNNKTNRPTRVPKTFVEIFNGSEERS